MTNAPVNEADNVFVEFNGMEIKPANGDPITFDFTERCTNDPTSCRFDLLLLTRELGLILMVKLYHQGVRLATIDG